MLTSDAVVPVLQDLHVDDDEIKKVVAAIDEALAGVDVGFSQASVPPASFGGISSSEQLGYHHARAHDVIQAVIDGMIVDLQKIRDGVVYAQQQVHEADRDAGADLAHRQQAVNTLQAVGRHSAADQAYDRARNQPATSPLSGESGANGAGA